MSQNESDPSLQFLEGVRRAYTRLDMAKALEYRYLLYCSKCAHRTLHKVQRNDIFEIYVCHCSNEHPIQIK